MRRILALLLLVCWMSLVSAAGPSVRARLVGKQPVLVGQQVHLSVTIVTPNYFTSAPQFPNIAIPGTIVTMPDESGTNSTEKIGDTTYAAIEKTYVFSAQQEGEFTLPPLKITFTYGGDDGKPRTGTVTLPPLKIAAKLPAGAAAAASAAGGALMPVAKVTITQRFDRAGTSFHVGDALVRTLDTYAAQTQAMMIPPPHPEAPAGVRVFAADPQLSDETKDRVGFLGGRRIDRITYVFEKAGTYTLPPVRVGWFDAQADRPRTAEAAGLMVTVLPGPATGAGIALEAASAASAVRPVPARRWRVIDVIETVLAAGAALLVATWGVRWFRRRLPGWRAGRAARARSHAGSEPVAFDAVEKAIRSNDAARTDAALLAWSRHLGTSVSAWAVSEGDAALVAALSQLRLGLYGGGPRGAAPPDTLLPSLRRARGVWMARRDGHAVRALPALNP